MKKKLFKIVGIAFLLLVAILIAIPFFLEGKITDIIKNKVNQNIDATLDFEDASLSLIKNFPDARLSLTNTSLINKAPFKGDTLFSSANVDLQLSVKELFKSADEPIAIKSLTLDDAKLKIKVDKEGNANYDITKESADEVASTSNETQTDFTLGLESYALTNTTIIYDDFSSGMHLEILEMNHTGTGDLSLAKSELKTQTEAFVSFELDSTKYLNKNKIALDAVIGLDLEENKYSFLENKVLVNQLPLVFDGFVKLNDDNQEVDISFKTPSSDFKNFLAVIPEVYSKNIEDVKTTGNFEIGGELKGIVDDTHIPRFNIKIKSENASFKYSDLPKSVENVYINTEITNATGITEDTFVNLNRISFQIDQDRFNLNAKLKDLLGNPKVNAHMDGAINLSNITKACPLPEGLNLSGLLNADVTTAFDMASVSAHQYKNTKTSGKMNLSKFKYDSDEVKSAVIIDQATVTFSPSKVVLNSFDGSTGATDFKANGTLDNLLGFVFNDEKIEGNFRLQSNIFSLSDFMVDEEVDQETDVKAPPTTIERIKIPSFLDCTIDATAGSVLYDNIVLKNFSGRLLIKDQVAQLENLKSDLFNGKLNLNGTVSTKEAISTFDMDLGMDGLKIGESFNAFNMLKAMAPVANALQGKLNTSIKLSGNLNDDMTPNLGGISGDVLAKLLSANVDTKNAPLFKELDSKLNFLNLGALDLKDLKTAFSFKDGKVNVKPFTINYKDIPIEIEGSHTFDMKLAYKANINVPAKYLGEEVNTLIARIDDDSLKDITIPVTAIIDGDYMNPKVTTDLTSGVTELTKQLVEIEKQKLLNKGKDKAEDLLGGLLGGAKTDTTKTTNTGVLTDILGSSKKDSIQTDTTDKNDAVKDAATTILGGLFGKKKKKDTVN